MYINKITKDHWVDGNDYSSEISCDSVEQINSAIRDLDGVSFTQVILTTDKGVTLLVGGGNDNRYIVQIAYGVDDRFINLISENLNRSDILEVTTGGQPGYYEAKYCVKLDDTLMACSEFAIHGTPCKELAWEEEGR